MRKLLVALLFLPVVLFATVTSQVDKTGPFLITALPQAIPTGFPFVSSSQLLVLNYGSTATPRDPADVLTLGSDYTVAGGGYNSPNAMQTGTVTVLSGGAHTVLTDDRIVIMRNVPINQTVSFTQSGPLTLAQIEQALDKQATLSQQVNEVAGRSLQFENFEFLNPTLSLEDRSGMILGFDDTGDIAYYTPSSAGLASAPINIPAYNAGNALTLTTPNPTSATYDSTPIAALFINRPAAATTRNFISGIWVETEAASTDKGRGIGIHNLGASDSLYIQVDGAGGTGFASLLTTNATTGYGGVIGTTLPGHVGLTIRQETAIVPTAQSSSLLSVEANGSATEMMRFGSTVASQTGIVFRMLGATSNPIYILGAADAIKGQWNSDGAIVVNTLQNNGDILLTKTITPIGTTGSVIINKSTGTANIAAGADTLTVTNNLVTVNSVIMATVATDDLTLVSVKAIAGAGSFVLKGNTTATATTRINFLVTN